jgi:hypothetical protein
MHHQPGGFGVSELFKLANHVPGLHRALLVLIAALRNRDC